MALEIRITSPTEEGFVKQIIWNADEISAAVAEKVSYYNNLVYTDTQITEAKKDRAELNKFIAALKSKDREIKQMCLQPYEEFHNKMLKIISQVEKPVNLIDKQIKDYEEQQKSEKRAQIEQLFGEKGFQPWVTLERIWNQKWLNKSYSIKQVEADLSSIQHSIGEDILMINQMGEGQPAALQEYIRSMDKTKAVEAGKRYIEAKLIEERTKAQREAEAAKMQAEIDRDLGLNKPVAEATQAAEVKAEAAPEVKKISFSVWVTREQLKALNACLKENGIRFEQIK